MDIKVATQNYRLQQWMAIFKDRANSGLSIRRYCEENGISRDTYNYWLTKARKAAIESAKQTEFVELPQPEPLDPRSEKVSCPFDTQLTISTDQFVIGVNPDTPKELLAMALEVISNVK